jgi:hypothetical protein
MGTPKDPLETGPALWEQDEKHTEAVATINELIAELGSACVLRALQDCVPGSRMGEASASADQLRLAREMLSELLSAHNVGLAVDLMGVALKMGVRSGYKITDIAARHGCTKQNASRMLGKMTRRLDIPRLPCQRTEKTKNSYREKNRRNYA